MKYLEEMACEIYVVLYIHVPSLVRMS